MVLWGKHRSWVRKLEFGPQHFHFRQGPTAAMKLKDAYSLEGKL